MGGVDEVVREWLHHVLIHCFMLWINGWIVFASKKAGKSVDASHMQSTQSILCIPDESSVREQLIAGNEIS